MSWYFLQTILMSRLVLYREVKYYIQPN